MKQLCENDHLKKKKKALKQTQNNIFELQRKIIQIEYNWLKTFFTLFPILTVICRRILAKPEKFLKHCGYAELQKLYLNYLMSGEG